MQFELHQVNIFFIVFGTSNLFTFYVIFLLRLPKTCYKFKLLYIVENISKFSSIWTAFTLKK